MQRNKSQVKVVSSPTVNKTDTVFNTNENIDLSILIEQYKIYIEAVNLTSNLRSQANTFYLTINTALLGFLSGSISFFSKNFIFYWMIFAGIAGIILCISWIYSIRSFRALNSGRFVVIHEIETKLPARLYSREWEIVTSKRREKITYIRQSSIETSIPASFCLLYIILCICIMFF